MPARILTIALLTTLCAFPTHARAQNLSATALAMLQGTWTVVAAEQRGKPFDAIKGGQLTIAGATFQLQTAAGNEFSGTIRLNTAVTPRQIDFVHATGGTVWEAIYSVTDDLFRLNYIEANGVDARPTLFATSAETAGTIIAMARAEPAP